ncbi:LAMI_0F10550g1_1 [Lachancea mirantina]|uniref:LAMI_0F10550g1_1 n=1 Tax=Lachancea mirantina TaxID=1230905 RepID=A0A1G4K1Y6_9SACH|nr:LAMI_0F10550g1_1 [Lachancea mirantina]
MDKSPTPSSAPSRSSTANSLSEPNSTQDVGSRRPKRSASLNVDYNLKKRKIIPVDDFLNNKRPGILPVANEYDEVSSDDLPAKEVLEWSGDGHLTFNEPKATDPVNGVTGLPLSSGPPDKVKKECFWNHRKSAENTAKSTPQKSGSISRGVSYKDGLLTLRSEKLTSLSQLRDKIKPKDIYKENRQNRKRPGPKPRHFPLHTKIKATSAKENKLFGQNSITNQKTIAASTLDQDAVIENEDFCASCLQPGVFLCCDTCPKSFHFACCNPPLDADNLPEGDWSCTECQFKMKCPNKSSANKLEKEFLADLREAQGSSLFGKLLFRLEKANPRQFQLSHSLRDSTFVNVHTGNHGEYTDDSLKEPLNEKQLFGAPYGQSLTKMDQFNPELHIDQENNKLLVCYNCRQSKMGTVDHPEDERLIMTCDYCSTPWHLDCLPDVPRASFKNLGSRWSCPLHANDLIKNKRRRLIRNQKFLHTDVMGAIPNDGDIDVKLDEIAVPLTEEVIKEKKTNTDSAIVRLPEKSIKLDFIDKIYRARNAQRQLYFNEQEKLVDKITATPAVGSSTMKDISSLLYFSLGNSNLKKHWDFKELCNVATTELIRDEINMSEITQLLLLKKALEAKDKKEVMRFFGI